jgi:hypothetical protein
MAKYGKEKDEGGMGTWTHPALTRKRRTAIRKNAVVQTLSTVLPAPR